ncbi:MAG: hypothetical protein OEY52_12950 [Gammaproteobacteria bacterium]|nr:hypothetical protein [Gammaproteobacteria bacterium]
MFNEPEDRNDYLYQVESIEKVTPPGDLPGDSWHRYIIGRGDSKIEGLKPGSAAEVRMHAEAVADDLNERANRKISTYASRSKKR